MQLVTRTPGKVYLAYNCTITGDVTIGELTSLWFNAVVRGDVAPVTIGARVNVQDHVLIHCDNGVPNAIEDDVTIGHGAIVHGRRVGRGSLVGMRATLLGQTVVGEQCIIGAGAVVPPGMTVPDRSVVMGVPGKVVRAVRPAELEHLQWLTGQYLKLAEQHVGGKVRDLASEFRSGNPAPPRP